MPDNVDKAREFGKTMTVRKLKEKLNEFNDDDIVAVYNQGGWVPICEIEDVTKNVGQLFLTRKSRVKLGDRKLVELGCGWFEPVPADWFIKNYVDG